MNLNQMKMTELNNTKLDNTKLDFIVVCTQHPICHID